MPREDGKIDERKKAGANYIFNFYNEVQKLKENFSNYVNLILELSNKYGYNEENPEGALENMGKIDDNEKAVITGWLHQSRGSIMNCYISFCSIFSNTKLKTMGEIKETYDKLRKSFIIDVNTFERYTMLMNELLLTDVVKNSLQSNQEFIETLS